MPLAASLRRAESRLETIERIQNAAQVVFIAPAAYALGNNEAEFAITGLPEASRLECIFFDLCATPIREFLFDFESRNDLRHLLRGQRTACDISNLAFRRRLFQMLFHVAEGREPSYVRDEEAAVEAK